MEGKRDLKGPCGHAAPFNSNHANDLKARKIKEVRSGLAVQVVHRSLYCSCFALLSLITGG